MMKFFKQLGKSGQTSVEYILLIAVVVVMINTVMQRVKEYVFAEQDNCTSESKSLVCKYERLLKQDQFRRFTLIH